MIRSDLDFRVLQRQSWIQRLTKWGIDVACWIATWTYMGNNNSKYPWESRSDSYRHNEYILRYKERDMGKKWEKKARTSPRTHVYPYTFHSTRTGTREWFTFEAFSWPPHLYTHATSTCSDVQASYPNGLLTSRTRSHRRKWTRCG
jgi:hypothetical protein